MDTPDREADGAKDLPPPRRHPKLPAGSARSSNPTEGQDLFGGGPFNEIGEEFFRHFIELGGLKPDERVLDLGCGIGGMAVPFTLYLSDLGSYEGFDVFPNRISWCQENITPSIRTFASGRRYS